MELALVEQLHNDLPDARWSWGACDGLFTPRPLGPLLDLADQWAGSWKSSAGPVLPVRICSAPCCAR